VKVGSCQEIGISLSTLRQEQLVPS
jgi:hypothetical protein